MPYYSRITHTGTGIAKDFNIPFPYITISTLYVTKGGIPAVYGQDYEIDNATKQVKMAAPVPYGTPLVIRRITPRTAEDRLVIFQNGSDLPAAILNNSDLFLLFIIQELLDDVADGIGVGDPDGGSGGGPGIPPNVQIILDQLADQIQTEHNERVASISQAVDDLVAEISSALGDIDAVVETKIETATGPGGVIAAKIDTVAAQLNDDVEDQLAAFRDEIVAEVGESFAETTLWTTLVSQVGTNEASIAAETSARVTDVEAIADQIGVLSAEVGNVDSRVTDESIARASAVGGLAATISNVITTLNDQSAAVVREEIARVTADTAIAGQVTTIESEINAPTTGIKARVTTVEATKADGSTVTALAGRTDTLEASLDSVIGGVADIDARIETEENVRASEDEALAERADALEATVNDPTTGVTAVNAKVSTEETARANSIEALARTIAQSIATFNDQSAAVTVETTARVNADNSLKAEYVLEVNANGVITGFRLTSLAGGAAPRSEAWFQADKFVIAPSTGSFGQVPFVVDGGNVYIDSGFIRNLGAGNIVVSKLSDLGDGSGIFRSSPTGARLELQDNVIKVFDASNNLRVKIGDLSL
jgi:hypothetical protein